MTKPDGRQVTPGYWIDRTRAWRGSTAILGYRVSRDMGAGWTAPQYVGEAATALGAREVIRQHQARTARVEELMAAARRLEHGDDPVASAMIEGSGNLLLCADEPIRLTDRAK